MRNFTTKTHKVETLRHTKKIRILEKISPQRTNFKNKIRGNQFNPFNPRSNKTSTHFYEFLPQRNTKQNTKNHKEINSPRIFA